MAEEEYEQLQLFDTTPYEEPKPERPPQSITCLFMVIINDDGGSQVVLDVDQKFAPHRLATPQDVYPSLANILADWTAMKQAEATVTFQAQLARKAAEAQAVEKMRQKLG